MRDILGVCASGANKTRIVCRANLNSARLNRYLSVYLAMGMLVEEVEGDRVVYKTTGQGLKFLEAYFGQKSPVGAVNGKRSV